MRHLLGAALLFVICSSLYAQDAPLALNGHYVGESIEQLLQREPEALQEFDVCKAHPTRSTCDRLIAAVQHGERADISTSNGMDFVLEGGRVVKLTMLLNESAEAAKSLLTEKFVSAPTEKSLPKQNSSGAKWENHLFVWNAPGIYVTLYQDNNPALQNAQPLVEAETQAEHASEDAELAKHTHELESNNARP